jgi:acetyl esterase/lipase
MLGVFCFLNPGAAQAQEIAQTASSLDSLLDKAANRVFKQVKGKIPDDIQDRVLKEVNRKLKTSGSREELLQQINKKIPENLKNKLPKSVLAKLDGVKMNRQENFSYWPGLLDKAHQMSLYTPVVGKNFPLIIYVHGGAWTARPNIQPVWLSRAIKRGYAVALVNYRLAQESPFPSQMEDLNTALAYIKNSAAKFNLNADRIGLWGTSAGGHLVSLMATSINNSEMSLGSKAELRMVRAACDFCGPCDLYTLGTEVVPGKVWDTTSATSSLAIFLGGLPSQMKTMALKATPSTYVSSACPPILILHGKVDNVVPFSQSENFQKILKAHNVDVEFVPLEGEGHAIERDKYNEMALNFFDRKLQN